MEVSLDNSVPFMVKITLLPGQKIYKLFTEKYTSSVCRSIDFLLNNPSLAIILISAWLIIFLPLLLYSFLATLAVFCVLWSIVIFEGFIILSLSLLSTIGTSMIALLTVCCICFKNRILT